MKEPFLFMTFATMLIAGCASQLEIHDKDRTTALPGVPVHSPLLVEIETTTSYDSLTGMPEGCRRYNYCKPQVNSAAKFLPLGDLFYLSFKAAPFGKSEFGLTFANSGVLTNVSLNSTPNIEGISGLLETVLPFVKEPKAAKETDLARELGCPLPPNEVRKKYCLKTGSKVTAVREIEVERIVR